jgi:hypothetical protein
MSVGGVPTPEQIVKYMGVKGSIREIQGRWGPDGSPGIPAKQRKYLIYTLVSYGKSPSITPIQSTNTYESSLLNVTGHRARELNQIVQYNSTPESPLYREHRGASQGVSIETQMPALKRCQPANPETQPQREGGVSDSLFHFSDKVPKSLKNTF